MTIKFVKKLEVVHKEVGGCLRESNAATEKQCGNPEMAVNLFSRLERFREESQVMAAHWFYRSN